MYLRILLLVAAAVVPGCAQRGSCPASGADARAATAGGSAVVATVGGAPITLAEVDHEAASDLYEARQKALDKMVTERAVAPAAKAAGLSTEDFLRREVEKAVPEVTVAEAAEFFKANKSRLPAELSEKSFEDVQGVLVSGLTAKKRQDAVDGVIDSLKRTAGVRILLDPPRVEVAAIGPARGPADARVTIIEFSDFQCPYCSRGRAVMDEVQRAYPAEVRLVFRDYPLPFHDHAEKAAEAGQCAHEQGKFWALHDWMFDHQSDLSVEALQGGAREAGLDGKRFAECLSSGRYAGAVAANVKAGEAVGVHGTPAFFVNGVMLSGALPFEKFKTQIDRALGR